MSPKDVVEVMKKSEFLDSGIQKCIGRIFTLIFLSAKKVVFVWKLI